MVSEAPLLRESNHLDCAKRIINSGNFGDFGNLFPVSGNFPSCTLWLLPPHPPVFIPAIPESKRLSQFIPRVDPPQFEGFWRWVVSARDKDV
jgi:hypothetical protein